jgi:hypothetical protein
LCGQKPGAYAYGTVPLREEITNTVCNDRGEPIAVVTRNLQGSLVLNAERVMFVDIDFAPVSPWDALAHFFARLFRRASKPPQRVIEETARAKVEEFVADNPGWSIRLYRTCAGFRGAVTHAVFDPKSRDAMDLLRRLGSDPLYVRLCETQECFRARLSPKPWRCGHVRNTVRFPIETPERMQAFEEWKTQYELRQRNYATCRFVADLGSGAVHPEVERILELHDFATRAREPLDLA